MTSSGQTPINLTPRRTQNFSMFDPMPESKMIDFEFADPLHMPAIVWTDLSDFVAPANITTGVGSLKSNRSITYYAIMKPS